MLCPKYFWRVYIGVVDLCRLSLYLLTRVFSQAEHRSLSLDVVVHLLVITNCLYTEILCRCGGVSIHYNALSFSISVYSEIILPTNIKSRRCRIEERMPDVPTVNLL